GVRSIEDPKLIEYLVEHQIPLTVCPLSNIKLCVFDEMGQHNIKQLLNMGVRVTVNSDDPAYFGGYMNENFLATQAGLDLSKKDLFQISRNAIEAAFITEERRQALVDELLDFHQHNLS
ncbi:MAG: adenosine deaminase, partial [Anaerolineaceae bacterium]|nr:adenosine deaminase [Anaerolineaceae bacterium]